VIYIAFIGIVLGTAMASVSPALSTAIVVVATFTAVITSLTTVVASSLLGGDASKSEAIKANIAALTTAIVIFILGVQAAGQWKGMLLVFPLVAYLAATAILHKGLVLPFPKALIVSAVGAIAPIVAINLFGSAILSLIRN
jgi:hypothetical protein